MLTFFWMAFWAGLATLVVAAGVSLHVRRKEAIASVVPTVDDDAVERILETGRLHVPDPEHGELPIVVEDDDEPLDQGEIDDEEERFWSESWDEPTEW